MSLSDLNYCILNENAKRKDYQKDLIRLAWYTAYFIRIEKLGPLKEYMDKLDKAENTSAKISVSEAGRIYKNILGNDGRK